MQTMEEMIYATLVNSASRASVQPPPTWKKRRRTAVPDDVSSSSSSAAVQRGTTVGSVRSSSSSSTSIIGSSVVGSTSTTTTSRETKKKRNESLKKRKLSFHENDNEKKNDDTNLVPKEFDIANLFQSSSSSSDTMFVRPADRSHVPKPGIHQDPEYQIRRHLWSAREYDIRTVPDVGNAIRNRMEILYKAQLLKDDDDDDVEETTKPNEEKEEEDDEVTLASGGGPSVASTAAPVMESTPIMEPQDGDVMQQLLLGTKSSRATESRSELDFWERGLTRPKQSVNIPNVYISARRTDIRNKNDDDDTSADVLVIANMKYLQVPKDMVTSSSGLYPLVFHRRLNAGFMTGTHKTTFQTGPQHFLKVLFSRYMGNNAATCKEEQQGHLTCLWRLQCNLRARKRLHVICEWQLTTQWKRKGLNLGKQLLWFIHNQWRLPKDDDGSTRLDFGKPLPGFDPGKAKRLHKNYPPQGTFPPHGAYLFIPLTSPPIPEFPLDRTEMTWGGMDRFANAWHRINEVPAAFYKLTTSIMLADRNEIKHRHNFEWCKEIAKKELYQVQNTTHRNKSYCERPAYGLAGVVHHILAIWNGKDDEECREWLGNILDYEEMAMMADLHLIHALMAISVNFENVTKVVEILSRDPLDFNPITMFQTIVSDHLPENSTQLEYTIHQHTKRTAVERYATDPIQYAWYIAFLATSLILCEGTASFVSIRIALAQAVKLLYNLHNHAPSEQTLATLRALGQWSKAWRLLLTGSSAGDDALRPVLLEEKDAFDVVARELEANPNSIDSWRRVVQVLGPISQSTAWYLRDREWWYDFFLKPFDQLPSDAPYFSSTLLIDDDIEAFTNEHVFDRERFNNPSKIDTEWLRCLMESLQNNETEESSSVEKLGEEEAIVADFSRLPLPELTEANDELECMAYKVLIIAHFRNPNDPDVGLALLVMVDKAWRQKSGMSSDGTKCLRWLREMGIDVNGIFAKAVSRQSNEPVRKKKRTRLASRL